MNTVVKRLSLVARLGLTGAALLLTQQAFAVGTTASTPINNQATVAYDVNGNGQTPIESAPGVGNNTPGGGSLTTFLVDNRVNFTLVVQDVTQTVVNAGDTNAVTEFLLTNLGNSVQDFRFTALDLPSVPASNVFGQDDTVDMALLTVAVDDGDNNPEIGGDDTATFVDELGEGAFVTIWVAGNALGAGIVDGDIANFELTAIVADGNTPGPGPGPDTTEDIGVADLPGTVQVVFANGVAPGATGDGTEADRSGYQIASAALNITKTSLVISDPFNGINFPKAIPGAIVQYTVRIDNTGPVDATDIVITDLIQAADVVVAVDGYGAPGSGEDIQITADGSTNTCSADGDNTDACTFGLPADTFSIGRVGVGGLTVPAGEFATILYQVTIQ